ncbi:MAG: type II toxin-antitoxin system PemK/MazF family toxin [Ignavibacteriae bacterium]|nr:type II toxin-antitoxin system PemK/MazF family toxin [Ignavibacteriota bacterium]
MAKFVKGDVVVVPFPFFFFFQSKRRPTIVLSALDGNDVILCQITSKQTFDQYAIELDENDFQIGNLSQRSIIRPNRIFTVDGSIILYRIGTLKGEKFNRVMEKVIHILRTSQ